MRRGDPGTPFHQVWMMSNLFGDVGVQAIAEALPKSKISTLHFPKCPPCH